MPQFVHVANGGGSFHTTVPGTVVVLAVTIALIVGFVVLLVIADEIVHGETIVRRDEVDRGDGLSAVLLIKIGGTHETTGELGQRGWLRAPEIAHTVTEMTVPFRPIRGESTHLISTGTQIPWFRDEFDP